ncbi:MAG: glutaminyl-peptide cyclotransferase [Bdellovibrionia bacterium]
MKKISRGFLAIIAALSWLGLEAWKVTVAASCGAALPLQYQILRQIQRSAPGFTEGLIYRNGSLFESTGGYGSSALNRIDPATGQVDALATLPSDQFGEGLESDGQNFYQLSWKEHRLNEWDANGKLKRSMTYPYEGWGLTRGSTRSQANLWVSSDGSNSLYFFEHAPMTSGESPWTASFKLPVMNGAKPESKLNELEFAQGAIFANVYQDNRILRIDPATGCVSGELDLSEVVRQAGIRPQDSQELVLNGIAYRPETDTFFITGKNWSSIYEVRIFPKGG